MHVQIVNFNLKDTTFEQYQEVCEQLAPTFADVPGLVSKVWLSDPDSNTYGGVYTWESREAMEAYGESELFQGVVGNPAFSNIAARDFEVLEAPTRVTRGATQVRA